GSTSARTRFSSPAFSSAFTNSRKSRYATLASLGLAFSVYFPRVYDFAFKAVESRVITGYQRQRMHFGTCRLKRIHQGHPLPKSFTTRKHSSPGVRHGFVDRQDSAPKTLQKEFSD